MNEGMFGLSQIMGGLAGGLTQVWLNVAFVVCAFVALILRPERICSRGRFRAGCTLFSLSLLVPGISFAVATLGDKSHSGRFGMSIIQYAGLLTALLYALAFYLAVTSMIPTGGTASGEDA